MSQVRTGGPVFPYRSVSGNPMYDQPGLSLRDWFAGQALTGMVANKGITDLYRAADARAAHRKVSEAAYQVADAMIAARDTP